MKSNLTCSRRANRVLTIPLKQGVREQFSLGLLVRLARSQLIRWDVVPAASTTSTVILAAFPPTNFTEVASNGTSSSLELAM